MCWECYSGDADPYKQFRQGGVDVSDFDEEVKYHKPRSKKKTSKKVKTRAGCPETDFGAHVYVWTEEFEDVRNLFFKFYGFHNRESEMCAGCGKKRKSRFTDKYEKRKAKEWKKRYGDEYDVQRGMPIPKYNRTPAYRWWRWESYDEEFRAFRQEWAKAHGGNPYYSWWF